MNAVNRKIKKTVGRVIALENEDAAEINSDEIANYTKELVELIKKSRYFEELSKSRFCLDKEKILELNAKMVEELDREFLKKFVKAIRKGTVFQMRRVRIEKIKAYFISVIDIFTRNRFLKQLNKQIESKRHLHGLAKGIVKHIWAVSVNGFLSIRNKELARNVARAGIYHDITLKKQSSLIADFEHPRTGARLVKYLGENDEVVFAVADHLSVDCMKKRKLPRTKTGRHLLKYDALASTSERALSFGKKSKGLIMRNKSDKAFFMEPQKRI